MKEVLSLDARLRLIETMVEDSKRAWSFNTREFDKGLEGAPTPVTL